MKNCKRLLLSALLGLLLVPVLLAENFYIENYYIDIDIDADGTNHIYEVMDLVFTEPSHGIIRDIQTDFDGLNAEVSNFQSNLIIDHISDEVDDYISYYLGDDQVTLTGNHKIKMKYDFVLDDDYNREYDEWYYNIVSSAFGTTIDNVEFHVSFPYPIDEKMLWATTGRYGSTDSIDEFRINSARTEIYGKTGGLGPHEAVTVRAEFPEGYFNEKVLKKDHSNAIGYSLMVIMILMVGIAFILYRKHGVDDEIIPVVGFKAPDGITPYDCTYLVDGAKDFKTGVVSMLLYWADKGYVRVIDDGEEKKKSISFEKLADLSESASKREKTFFGKVFLNRDVVDMEDLATLSLKGIEDIRHDEQLHFEKEEPLYEKAGDRASVIITIMSILIAPMMLIAGLGRGDMDIAVFFLFPAVFQLMLNLALLRPHSSNGTRKKGIGSKIKLVLGILLNIFFGLIIMGVLALSEYDISPFVGFLLPTVEVVASISLSLLSGSSRKRTEYATRTYGEIWGFRDFIEFAEKDRIAMLVDEDPEYFYHILCYAIAFGLSDEYMEKFKGLRMVSPYWYEGPDMLDYMYWSSFNRRYRNCYQNAYAAVAPKIQTGGKSGSGSFSGSSGFSGGGFSGGGARSW